MVFTDLANSTALKTERGDVAVGDLITRHRDHVTNLAAKNSGRIIDWAGDGCFLTFEIPSTAAQFALGLQQIHAKDSDLPGVRVGLHMGEVTDRTQVDGSPRVEGLAVDLAARIGGLAVPGQVLMSEAVFNSARQRLNGEDFGTPITWLAHGAYELKGFDEPMSLCEVGIESMSPLTAPVGSEKAHRAVTPAEEETLGWRPAVGLAVPRRENWVLDEQLGEGGYGEVWLAAHAKTKAKRVFKFCFDPERVRGLKREVVLFRLLKESLGHREDIAQILDWEFERNPYFLESEYTEGGDLGEWAKGKGGLDKIPLETRLELVAQAAGALGAAHSVGVLHKDIKPGNILVSEVAERAVPRASLTDFGIGLITDPAALAAQGITAVGLTETLVGSSSSDSNSGAGTRLYMAPEVLEGKPATTLSDVYSLGVMLYQVIMGDLSHAIAPGWERDINDELLREDIGLCVDGDPGRRLKSADDLAQRLRTLDERRTALRKRRTAGRRRRLLVASSIVGPVITVLILLFAFQQTRLVNDANRQRELAEAASVRAVENAEAADAARRREEVLRVEAELDQHVASVRLAANLLDQGNVVSAQERLRATPAVYRNWEWGHLVNRAWPPEERQESGLPKPEPGKTTIEIWGNKGFRLVSTLVGHATPVNAIRFHPDGRRVITASGDSTLRVWDIESGRELYQHDIEGYNNQPEIALSLDGKQLLSGFGRFDFALWNTDTGERLRIFDGDREFARAMGISADGRYGLTGSIEPIFDVWNLLSGEHINQLRFAQNADIDFLLPNAQFVPGETKVLYTMTENRVGLWDFKTDELIATHQGPRPDVFVSGRISPDGAMVASWAKELGSYVIWDVQSGREIVSGSFGQSLIVSPVIWSPDGTYPLMRTNTFVRVISVTPETIESAVRSTSLTVEPVNLYDPGAFSLDGSLIALPAPDGTVRIYAPVNNVFSPEEITTGHDDICYQAVYSPNGNILVTGSFDGSIHFHDAQTLDLVRRIEAHEGEVTTLSFSPDGRYLHTFGYDDYSRMWELSTGKMLWETKGNIPDAFAGGARGPAVRVSSHLLGGRLFSPNENIVVAPNGMGNIVAKRLPEGDVAYSAKSDQGWSYKSTFSPDGNFLLNLPYQENFLTLFDGRSGAVVGELRGHTGMIVDRRFSPDGSRIITTSVDGTARIWDGRTGEPLLVFSEHGASPFTADFSANGGMVVTGAQDSSAKIWRVETGEVMATLPGHGGMVNGVRFSPDGKRVLTAALDNVARVWNLEGDLLLELHLGEGETLYHTAWSPDGMSIVMTSSNGTARVWRAVNWNAFSDPLAAEEDFEAQLERIRLN